MKNFMTQRELFNEFERPKKRKKKTSHSILPKSYIPLNVSHEQLIFVTIAVIMLMVLLFSLGVERGKYLASSSLQRIETIKTVEPSEPEIAEAPVEEKAVEKRRAATPRLFTIQVIAYRSKKSAQKELLKLSKKGFKPFVIVGSGYYQVCVGEYRDQSEFKNDLLELRKVYKDSFIRKR